MDGEVWESEIVNERKDSTEFVVDQTIAPITDEEGDITHFVAINHDVTERKERERRLRDQRDNLELLHQILRHDIRNDLQLISSAAELLAEEGGADKHLKTIRKSARHAVSLSEEAREMADAMLTTGDDCESVALRSVLLEQVDAIRSGFPKAEVTVDGSVPGAAVLADDMLDSVFRYLLKNAVQPNDKDVPEVRVSATELEDSVTVRVADNGPGLPAGRGDEVFEKGTTGSGSDGTGLGLYLVESLTEAYGGDIRVADEEVEGVTFLVDLSKAGA